MNVEKNVTAKIASVVSPEVQVQAREEDHSRYASSSYQKVLDYHVSEILLMTIIIGTILLLRLHR